MVKKIVWQWEEIDENTSRTKVVGGWLIQTKLVSKNSCSVNTMFFPDHDWQWQPCKPFVDPQVQKANIAKEFAKSD